MLRLTDRPGTRYSQVKAKNKFYLAAVVLSDAVVETVRRELRRLSDAKLSLSVDDLRSLLKTEVIKREVIEGEKADAARKKVGRSANKVLRRSKEDEESSSSAKELEAPPPSDD
jgi:hypothetical protein